MSRSVKKGPYVDPDLFEKVLAMRSSSDGKAKLVIKTWARSSTIFPQFIGITFMVHNGREFIPVLVNENMVGHKLGEFAATRTFRGHSGDRKTKK